MARAASTNNVFVQVGLVMLIGLAAKNSILIVEFAKMKRDEGTTVARGRARGGAPAVPPDPDDRLRLHARRRAAHEGVGLGRARRGTVMGTAVFWGMLVATALGVFVTPALYTFVEGLRSGGEQARGHRD